MLTELQVVKEEKNLDAIDMQYHLDIEKPERDATEEHEGSGFSKGNVSPFQKRTNAMKKLGRDR